MQKTPEKMLEFMLPGGDSEIIEVKYPEYRCDCSREGMLRGVLSLGKDELEKIISEQDKVETVCHYCLKKYHFDNEEIKRIMVKPRE
jgi:molecular chaperone Hsp33